jgi:hypothetical protein
LSRQDAALALGADLAAAIALGGERTLDLALGLGWLHEYANTARPITAAFAGAPSVDFAVYGAMPQRDSAVIGFSAATAIASRAQLHLRYDGEVAVAPTTTPSVLAFGSAGSGQRSDPVELLAQFGGRRLAAIDWHMRRIGVDPDDRRRFGQSQTGFGLVGPPSSDVSQRLERAQAFPAIWLAP